MAFKVDSLIPARFLTLLANLIILILSLWSREGNVVASLSSEYEDEEYYDKDKELTIGLSLGVSLVGIELIGFFTGLSMFNTSIALLSIFLHGLASVLLSQWLVHAWQASTFWIIFGTFFVIPAITELVNMCSSFLFPNKEV